MANKILNLDLSKNPIMQPIIYGRVGDSQMQKVTVNITDNDQQLDLTGFVITFEGTLNGEQIKVFDSDNVSADTTALKQGSFSYTFPSSAFSQAGKYSRAYFSIAKDGKRNTTGDFKIFVDENADIDAEEAKTVITEYNKLVAELNDLQKKTIDSLNKDIASVKSEIDKLQSAIDEYEASVKSSSETAIKKVTNAQDAAIATIESTKTQAIQTVDATKNNAVEAINDSKNQAIVAVDDAVNKLNDADVYSKKESDALYAEKDKTYTKEEVEALITSIKIVPPIGYILTNSKSTFDPNKEYQGTTWQRYAQGRTLFGASDTDSDFSNGKAGGSKTISIDYKNLPKNLIYRTSESGGAGWNNTSNVASGWRNGSLADIKGFAATSEYEQPINNLQPYIAVYMWVRTA